jgi:hypothetical protein
VRGGDTDITFGRLVFFFSDAESNSYRRDYWLDWPCQRLTILRVSRSKLTERNSIRTQSNWRLRSNLSSPLSLFVVVLLLIAVLFIYLFFPSFLFLPTVLFYLSCPLFSFVLDEIFNSRRKEKEKWRYLLRNVVPFFLWESVISSQGSSWLRSSNKQTREKDKKVTSYPTYTGLTICS